MDSVRNYFREKTLTEKCTDYMKNNPGTVLKGGGMVIAGLYIIPWAPYLAGGYFLYQYAREASWIDQLRKLAFN